MAPRVLIVASDQDIGEFYALALARGLKCRSRWVPDAASGQRTARRTHYDAVLLDIGIPAAWSDCRGFAEQLPGTPVVAVTGWVAPDGRFQRQAFECGCAAFILKPCTPETLVETLRRVWDGERDLQMLSSSSSHLV